MEPRLTNAMKLSTGWCPRPRRTSSILRLRSLAGQVITGRLTHLRRRGHPGRTAKRMPEERRWQAERVLRPGALPWLDRDAKVLGDQVWKRQIVCFVPGIFFGIEQNSEFVSVRAICLQVRGPSFFKAFLFFGGLETSYGWIGSLSWSRWRLVSRSFPCRLSLWSEQCRSSLPSQGPVILNSCANMIDYGLVLGCGQGWDRPPIEFTFCPWEEGHFPSVERCTHGKVVSVIHPNGGLIGDGSSLTTHFLSQSPLTSASGGTF